MKNTVYSLLKKILPPGIRKKIFHIGFNVAPDEFLTFAHDFAQAPNMHLGLRKLAARGLNPSSIVDIGAYHGDWSLMANSIWPEAQIVMIEANEQTREQLGQVAERLGAEMHMSLVGASNDQEMTFHVMDVGSSVFAENSPLDRTAKQLRTRTLDDILGGRPAQFIKIDVQGFELEVLRGAPNSIAQAEAILLEISLIEINQGAPLFAQVIRFMDECGFAACDVLEIHRRPLDQATNQIDLLFLRRNSALLSDTRHF